MSSQTLRRGFVLVLLAGLLMVTSNPAAPGYEEPTKAKITFLSGSFTIDKNNNYVITWKTTNPSEIAVSAWVKFHGINDDKFYTCRADWNNPATNTCYMNVGKKVATGVSFRFKDGSNNTLISETSVIPLKR